MALTNLALFGGSFFTPIVVGKITHSIGWPWSFYLIAIFSGVMLPLVILFCPETAYRRHDSLNTDIIGDSSWTQKPFAGIESTPRLGSNDTMDEKVAIKKASFVSMLLPFNGRKSSEPFWKLLLRPFPLFLHPGILFSTLIQGTLIGWTVLVGVVLAAIFLGPPLWFDEEHTGYMYAGPFIGAILGFVVAGSLSDWSAQIMTRYNRGIYEPEFRLVLVLLQLICGCVGLYGFGVTASQVTRYGWFWPDFFFALEVMGMVIGAIASALYIVDAHREYRLSTASG